MSYLSLMATEEGRLGDSYVIVLIVDKQCQADLFHIHLKEEFFCTQKEKNLFNQKRVLVVQGAISYSVSKMQNVSHLLFCHDWYSGNFLATDTGITSSILDNE